jgi:hypothetical protein
MTTVQSLPTSAGDGPAIDLGPVILEQKATHAIGVVYLGAGGIFAGLGLAVLLFPMAVNRTAELATGGVFVALGVAYAVAGVLRIWKWRGGGLFLHERGIREHRAGRDSVVRFDAVEEMKYQSTRVLVHGSYGGTVERLSVRPDTPGAQWLYFQRKWMEKTGLATGYTQTSEVDRVARTISSMLAQRMSERLAAGETVAWTSRMRLHRDGIELSRTRWYECELGDLFRRQPRWEFFAWNQIERTEVNQGLLFLWVKGQRTPRLRVLAGEVNFQSGYALFAAALRQSTAPAEAARPSAPLELKAANRGENLTVRFTWNAADHIARQWHWDRSTPQGRKDWLVRIWVPTGIAAILCLLPAVAARVHNHVSTLVFLLLLVAIVAGGCVFAGLLHVCLRWSERLRISKEIKAAHELAKSGAAVDPLAEFEIVLGPPGYVRRRMGGGEAQLGWQQISRVEYAAGYIFLHAAGSKLAPESIDMMIPPRAFASQVESQAAADRIKDWHARAVRRGA